MSDTKIVVKLDQLNEVISELTKVKSICYDENVLEIINKIIKFIDIDMLQNKDIKGNLLDKIYGQMLEMKAVDDELNASLYILYQELKNDRINISEAIERFDLILKTIEYK